MIIWYFVVLPANGVLERIVSHDVVERRWRSMVEERLSPCDASEGVKGFKPRFMLHTLFLEQQMWCHSGSEMKEWNNSWILWQKISKGIYFLPECSTFHFIKNTFVVLNTRLVPFPGVLFARHLVFWKIPQRMKGEVRGLPEARLAGLVLAWTPAPLRTAAFVSLWKEKKEPKGRLGNLQHSAGPHRSVGVCRDVGPAHHLHSEDTKWHQKNKTECSQTGGDERKQARICQMWGRGGEQSSEQRDKAVARVCVELSSSFVSPAALLQLPANGIPTGSEGFQKPRAVQAESAVFTQHTTTTTTTSTSTSTSTSNNKLA